MSANREILMKFITQQNEKVKQDISMQGYKDDSPYRNNPSNTIYGTPQGTAITMQGVSTPLVGMDEFGNRQGMFPGQEYQFPGSRVVETPMAKYGGLLNKTIKCNNCGWSWKAADGGNDVSTCHKCGNENVIMQEGGPTSDIKNWFAEYIQSPNYKKNLENSGYENVDAEIAKRLSNIDKTKYVVDENRLGTYYNPGSRYIHHSPMKDVENWEGAAPESEYILAHEFGHSGVAKGPSTRLNKNDIEQLGSRNKNKKSYPGENYADQKALQYEAAKLGIYDPGTQEFTQEHLDQLKNTGHKSRALENYSDEDLIWLMNNIAEVDNQSPLPIGQRGGQKKPVYVESENDPRYTAYQDSLSAYNLGNIKIKEYNAAIKKGKEKGTPLKVIPRNSPFTPYPGTNILPIAAGLASPTGTQYGPEGSDVSLWTSYSKWKKPQQQVIVKPTTTKQTTKPANTSWKPLTPEIAKGRYEGDLKNMVYRKKADGSYDITYQAPLEVSRQPVKALQNNLKPKGLIQSDIEFNADMSGLRPVARIPKYYDVEDVVNNGKSQTNYKWYPENNESLRELSEEEGDKRIMVPHYQIGGESIYTTSGNPVIIPTQGSYPLSYRDRGDRDIDGTLFSAAKKVSRVDENGKPLTRNQIAYNQDIWNDQKLAYSPNQQAFNIWKNNEENTKQGYFVPREYEKLMRKLDARPEVERYETNSASDLRRSSKANAVDGPGFCGSILNKILPQPGCIFTDEDKSGVKKQNGGDYTGNWFKNADVMSVSNKYQEAGTVKYGTPEYEEAYNRGEVITDEGVRSPILLDEVIVKGKRKPKGFWEQSRDKYLKDNADAGLLGAIGSVVTYPLSLGQHALTYGIEGKVQDPDEAWGYNTDEGWFDGAGAFSRNLVDASLNLGLDPANLIGAGILTKEKALSKLASLKNFTRRPRNINIDNVANTADDLTTDDLFDIAIERSSNDGQFLFDPTIDPLDNPDVIDVMQQSANISAMPVEKGSKLKKFINKPILPYNKQVLPEKLEFKIKNDGRSNIKIEMVDPKTKDVHAFLDLNYHDDEWLSPSYIEVKNKLQGKQVQDLLYQKGVEEAQKNGFKGVRSGDHLLSPDKTLKSHGRFEKVALQPDASTMNPDIPISGLTKHTNPNLYNEFFETYKKLPKHVQGKYSVNDLYKMYINHVMKNKDDYAVGAFAIPTLGAMADVAVIPSFGEGYESRILKWLHEQDDYQNPYDNSSDVTKYQIGGATENGGQLQNLQFAGLVLNDPARKEYAQRVVQEAERRIRDRDYITSEEVPQNVKEASAREGKLPFTCIGGVCDVYKTAGVLNNINWSNTDFALHAKDYGFTANQGWGLKGVDNLEPGDIVQYKDYMNDQGKYYPSHSRIFLGVDANGKYRFFDNQAQGEQVFDRSELKYWLDNSRKDTEPNAVIFKVNPYNNDNPLGLTTEEKEVYDNKQDMIKKDSTSKSSYKWSISPTAKDYNENTKRVMDKFLNFANDNDKINDLVKKTGKSKEEIQDSLLNVFGELGTENNWTTSRGKGLGSLAENVAESVLTAFGGGKSYSVGPGQIKYSELQKEENAAKLAGTKSLKEQFNITSPNDLYDVDKVLPLMTAMDLRDKQVLENWGKNNTLERKLFGVENYDDPFTIEDLPARNNSDSRLDDTVGRYSPYLRNQYSSISSGTTLEGDDDWIPFNERVEPNYVPSEYYNQPGTMRVKYERDPGSYPDKVEQNWRENLNRVMTTNADGAIELDEVVIPNKQTGGLTKYQTKGEVVDERMGALKVRDNVPSVKDYNLQIKKEASQVKLAEQQQKNAQRKFNKLPKKEQEKILYDQYNAQRGSIRQYTPESTLSSVGNIALAPFSALKAKMETGQVPDNLVKGLIQNPDQINPYDAAYLGSLIYAGAPVVATAAAPYATMIGNSLGANALGVAGLNAGNALTAGFAAHGAMNILPDLQSWYNKPTEEGFTNLAFDALEMLPAIGPASKTIGEGMTAAGRALGTEEGLLSNAYKLNPKAYQYNLPENTMWRGLGKEGMEDAVSSGLFRSKQNVEGVKIPNTSFTISKSFGINPYFTPKFKTAARYGDNFLAEVPRDVANWRNRYGRGKTWSQIADRPIPVNEGRILQKDWWQGYKPIDATNVNRLEQTADNTLAPIREATTNIIDDASSIKNLTTTIKNRNKKLLTIGAENLDNELLKKISQLESPEGFKRLVAQEAEMLRRDFPQLEKDLFKNMVGNVDDIAINNAYTRISELYQTALKGNINTNYLQAKKLNPKLTPADFDIPVNNAFFRPANRTVNLSDGVINLSKEPSSQYNIFNKSFYKTELPGEIAIGREYAEGMPVYDHEINHALQNTRNTVLDDQLRKYFNNSENLTQNLTIKDNKAYNYFRKNKSGMPSREPSSFLAEARRAMLERGLIKDIYEKMTPKKVFEAMKYFKNEPFKNPYTEQSYHRIFDFANISPQNIKFLSDSFNKLPAILPVGLVGAGAASQMQTEQEPVSAMKEMGGMMYANKNAGLPHEQSMSKYLSAQNNLLDFMKRVKVVGGPVPFDEYYRENIINPRNKS
jgi:hypothetical protein